MKSPKGFRGKYFSLAAILALSTTVTLANEVQSFTTSKQEVQTQEEYDEKEELTPPAQELDVTIISKKITVKESDATFASEIYTKSQIEKSRAKDIYEFLNTQSSVVTLPSYGNVFSQSIDMRGYGIGDGYENVVISLNGRRLNNIDMVAQLLSSIPLESIERIEVIKGSGSVEYGDSANAGVINIITKGYEGAIIKSYIGDNGLFFASLGLGIKQEKFSLSGSIDDYSHDGYKTIASDGTKDKSWARNKEIKATFTPVEDLTLNLGKSFSKMQINYANSLTLAQYNQNPYTTPVPNVFWWGSEQDYKIQSYSNDVLNYGLKYNFSQKISLDFQAYNEDKESTYTSIGGSYPSSSVSKYESDSYNLIVNYTDDALKVALGANKIDGTREAYGYSVSKDNIGYYAKTDYTYQKSTFSLGARVESAEYNYKKGAVNLKDDASLNAFDIGYSYRLDATNSFFINLNQSYQFPDVDRFFNAFTDTFNGFIKPMKVKTLNVGYNYLGYPNKLKISAFYSHVEDEIYYNAATWTNTNLDKTRKYGAELYDRYNVTYNLFTMLNYAYVETKIKDDSANPSIVGREIPGVSKHNVKLSLGYNPTHRINLLLSHVYKSRAYAMSDFDGNYGKMEAYNSTDFSATYKYKNYEIFAKVNNLFDEENALFADDGTTLGVYPVNYERNFMLGFKATF